MCYFITIYLFGKFAFDLTTGGNLFILKYAFLNFVITNLLVVCIVFIEKRFEVSIGVENEES